MFLLWNNSNLPSQEITSIPVKITNNVFIKILFIELKNSVAVIQTDNNQPSRLRCNNLSYLSSAILGSRCTFFISNMANSVSTIFTNSTMLEKDAMI